MEPPFLIVRSDDGRSVRLALPIAEFFALQDAARTLMGRALSGDQQAGKQVEAIFALAEDPNSNEQAHAHVSAYCLSKAMQEIQAQRTAWQAQQQTQVQQAQAQTQAQAQGGAPTTQAENAIPSRRRAPPAPPVPTDEMASCPHGLALDLPCPSCQAAAAATPPPMPAPMPAGATR